MKRNQLDERSLTATAAESAQVPLSAATSLSDFADSRALPGEVLLKDRPVSLPVEADQEAADLRNYLVWWRQSLQPRLRDGDPAAREEDLRAARAMIFLLALWSELHPESAS